MYGLRLGRVGIEKCVDRHLFLKMPIFDCCYENKLNTNEHLRTYLHDSVTVRLHRYGRAYISSPIPVMSPFIAELNNEC